MTTLREARKKGRLDRFIAEHEADPPGDMDKLDVAIKRPSEDRGASKPDSGDN